jgi:hypothetical protein
MKRHVVALGVGVFLGSVASAASLPVPLDGGEDRTDIQAAMDAAESTAEISFKEGFRLASLR